MPAKRGKGGRNVRGTDAGNVAANKNDRTSRRTLHCRGHARAQIATGLRLQADAHRQVRWKRSASMAPISAARRRFPAPMRGSRVNTNRVRCWAAMNQPYSRLIITGGRPAK